MICCAYKPSRSSKHYRLNDKQLASLLNVPVKSGVKMEKYWANMLHTFLEIGATDSSQILKVVRSPPDDMYIGGRWLWCHLQDFFTHYPNLDPDGHFHTKHTKNIGISKFKLANILKIPHPGMSSESEEEISNIFWDKKLKLLLDIGATNIDQLYSLKKDPLLGDDLLRSSLDRFYNKYRHVL